MKNFLSIILFNLLLTPAISMAQDSEYKLASIQPRSVFAPKGFDTNDNAQVVLYGVFADVCHKVAQPKFTVDQANHKIFIDNQAYTRDMCIMILVDIPYTVVVNLGTLPKDNYDIYVSNGNAGYMKASTLPITAAKNPEIVDDYLYAQVDETRFVPTSDASAPQLVLKGSMHNTCLSMREIKVTLTAGNIYDILPILDVANTNCKGTDAPFEMTVNLKNFPQTPTLINIRTSGGQSIEKVIDLSNKW
jgi:hypothetical protein